MNLKAVINDSAAIVVAVASAALVARYLWRELHGGAAFYIMTLFVVPPLLAGLLLLWRLRADVHRDPVAPFAVFFSGCVLLCLLSLPEMLGLYDYGTTSPRHFGISICIYVLILSAIRPIVGGIYRQLHHALHSLFQRAQRE